VSWSRIAIYYGLALALAVYLFGVQWMRAPEGTADSTRPGPLVHAAASDVTRVDLLRKRRRVRFERRDGRWQAVEPQGLSVTSDLVEALVDTLTRVSPIEVVSLGTADPKPFGLAPPQTVIVLGESGTTATRASGSNSGNAPAQAAGGGQAAEDGRAVGSARGAQGSNATGGQAGRGGQGAGVTAGVADVERVELGSRSPTQTAVYARKGGDAGIYLLGLNASYYVDLIYQEVDKQGSTSGASMEKHPPGSARGGP